MFVAERFSWKAKRTQVNYNESSLGCILEQRLRGQINYYKYITPLFNQHSHVMNKLCTSLWPYTKVNLLLVWKSQTRISFNRVAYLGLTGPKPKLNEVQEWGFSKALPRQVHPFFPLFIILGQILLDKKTNCNISKNYFIQNS